MFFDTISSLSEGQKKAGSPRFRGEPVMLQLTEGFEMFYFYIDSEKGT